MCRHLGRPKSRRARVAATMSLSGCSLVLDLAARVLTVPRGEGMTWIVLKHYSSSFRRGSVGCSMFRPTVISSPFSDLALQVHLNEWHDQLHHGRQDSVSEPAILETSH